MREEASAFCNDKKSFLVMTESPGVEKININVRKRRLSTPAAGQADPVVFSGF